MAINCIKLCIIIQRPADSLNWHSVCNIAVIFSTGHTAMEKSQNCQLSGQSGFTLIEIMIVITLIGILAAIAGVSYQTQVRQSHLITIYQETNYFRLPYQILTSEGGEVTDFSLTGLNMPDQTEYCQFSVTAPNSNSTTLNAVTCTIQKLKYVEGETISLDRATDGTWQCRASSEIPTAYLPKECQQ